MRTEEWISDRKKFHPEWEGQWSVPDELLDFEEKKRAFADPSGRLMSCAHRGDRNVIYPENTLEGYESVIRAGADMLEIDLHTTADGEIVIMHDDTLTRMTDLPMRRQAGENWMPESDEIRDWTLEQIKRLRIVKNRNLITPFAVPTLREVFRLAKGRVFVTLDKIHCFDWDDVERIIEEEDVLEEVLIPYNYELERVRTIMESQTAKTGRHSPFFAAVGLDGGIMSPELIARVPGYLREHDMPMALRGGEYLPEEREALEDAVAGTRGRCRFYAETLRREHDNEACWQDMLDYGYNIIMGNKPYEFIKFLCRVHGYDFSWRV
ncbi:MAG: glycerophosphodiester phosphodiesterase family protein [Lachnospiraceae bacterium]|nr:glycerophosphodiester phosphodiesterase family protein [Lachnospiraceae bacterium]